MSDQRRFTGRQLAVIIVTVCVTIIAFPFGVYAATTGSAVNVTDPTNSAYIAGVDSTHHLLVGDGSGALTVDGTVATHGVDQTVTLWSYQLTSVNGYSSPHFPVAKYGQVRVSFRNDSSGPCTVYVFASGSQYAASIINEFTLAVAPYSPDWSSNLFQVPGRSLWVASKSCHAEVEIYARP
jgi:hypothetical protein